MTPPYTVDYFIQKFEAIPDEKWGVGSFKFGSKRCAMGHCGVRETGHRTPESLALERLFKTLTSASVTGINDIRGSDYPQPTPKARILAALRDIQKKQEKA